MEFKKPYLLLKRVCDLSLAMVLLIILFPFFLLITILQMYYNDGNVFFVQQRSGINDRIFSIIKFRTMNDKRDLHGNLLPDEHRITPSGKFLRQTSIDELPQLLNVIKGDMSLVGPRPLLPEYVPLYNSEQRRRNSVLPGITGWAQVNGRNATDWDTRLAHDVWYADHFSLGLDVKILLLTLLKVIRRDGVTTAENSTMEKFQGSVNKP